MRYINWKIVVVAGILLLTCAKQGYPPGGPVDKRPPFIVSSVPAKDFTNVSVDTKIELVFSEIVNHGSCEEAIFITPFPGENIKYKWKGKKLKIEFAEPLAHNRTYIITIGAGAKDRRNNAMKASHTLAFSTGAELDIAAVKGTVFSDKPAPGTQIWAYDLKETPDPNPAEHFPLYITQVGSEGDYELSHLAWGDYRLLAVNDRDMNSHYDAEFDLLGVSSRDLHLSLEQPVISNVNFKIVLRDTTAPVLRTATAIDQRHVELRFSERMAPDSLSSTKNYLVGSNRDTLAILDAFLHVQNPFLVYLTTEEQLADTLYYITVHYAQDLVGHPLAADTLQIAFKGSARPDTLGPVFTSMTPADSAKNVMTNTTLDMYFSEALNIKSVENFFSLQDTAGNKIKGAFTWHTGAHFTFIPHEPLAGETLYLAKFPVDSVTDYFGNQYADTLFVKGFTTVNPDTLSELSGAVTDQDSSGHGAFCLQATSNQGSNYDLWVEKEGDYLFKDILPGVYRIQLFRDDDGNNAYSYGEAWPYKPAERIYMYPDSINVRSRWANEGNDLFFPQ